VTEQDPQSKAGKQQLFYNVPRYVDIALKFNVISFDYKNKSCNFERGGGKALMKMW